MQLVSVADGVSVPPKGAPRGRRAVVLACACLLLGVPLGAGAQAPDLGDDAASAATVLVAPSLVDRDLEAVAPGFAEFVRQQLGRMGVAVVPGAATRQVMVRLAPGPNGMDTFRELAPARRTGAQTALLVDLRSRRGFVEIDLRVYELEERTLVGGALGVGTLVTLAHTTNPVLLQVLPALAPAIEGAPPSDGLPGTNQLAAASRALDLLDRKELADAWRELDGLQSSYLSAVREQIQYASTQPGISIAEHARFVVAQGRASDGWKMIFGKAEESLRGGTQDAPLMLAAGEAQLAIGDAAKAARYFKKSKALAPTNVAASLGLARAYRATNQIGDARREFERAAELAPSRSAPLEDLAELHSTPPKEKARYLLEAGRRSATHLRSEAAFVNLDRAVKLDASLGAKTGEERGALHARIGQHAESVAAYREAIRDDRPTAERLRGVARGQSALRDTDAAEATYLEVLKMDHNDVGALRDLGEIYVEKGDASMAVVRLERAEALEPADPDVKRSLAKALHKRGYEGDLDRARGLHTAANSRSEPTAENLQDVAELQQAMGDTEGAVVTLERALLKRHLSMYSRQALADVYIARGDKDSAQRVLSVVRLVSGEAADTGSGEYAQTPEEADRFDALLQSFAGPSSYRQQVVFLGLGTSHHWRDVLVEYLHPRGPDVAAIETGILGAVDRSHTLVGMPIGALDVLGGSRDDLFRFDQETSRRAELITFANLTMETNAVFLGRVLHPLGSVGAVGACGSGTYYVLELRKLSGQTESQVSVLANRACVSAGLDGGYSDWNLKAIPAWSALALLLAWPFIRGWGRVRVFVRAPEHGKALFSVSISRRPKKFKEDKKQSAAPSWRFEKRLQSVRGSARRLRGRTMLFSFVAARRKPYYVTVRGPLLDLATDKLIGEFLEEKTVRVYAWRTNEVKFDMQTETAAITVKPKFEGGTEEFQVRVGLRGDAQSVRFTSNGSAYLYAPPGEHVVVVGALDRVAEVPIEVKSTAPIQLEVDMTEFENVLFTGCPDAVAPYVECDYPAAAQALEAVGDRPAAERVKALSLRRRGDTLAAAQVLEDAGMHAESVQLRLEEAPAGAEVSGDLLEQGGEHERAGEAFEASGDLPAAARNYELAYAYQRAADCYESIGDTEKVLEMLEALGDVFEAGARAGNAGQVDRAIYNLQQVDGRHRQYSEACRLLAEMLTLRGEVDLAVLKYGEAMEIWGNENAPLELQQSYAELLEQADRELEALDVYESIRRRDVHFGDVATRIETIRKHVSTMEEQSGTQTALTPAAEGAADASSETAQIGDENSRYEILDELGRGGMGVVFRARDRHLGRVVALKVLPDNLRQHPQAVKLFLREARAAAALNHQNIVTLFDAGQEGDAYFLTMECLEGSGLEAVLASRGALPTKAAATVALQVAAGLDYAQRAKIVHRDIKPSNLFLTRDRTVKIMDFGLAKMVEEVRRGSTVIGGTPNFMAPEQATGGDVDHRTDLYALGGTLFELVTGSVPFESGDVVYHHVHTPPPDARERNLEVPEVMAALILDLMAKNPDERVQSARELASRLQAILKG